jgi:TetR/AcrR family transcriptional regulator, regulator of autoinduction and epiphytic fitness
MLDSARSLFVSQGYENTTMAEISTHADVAVQTLYYTFQTKGKLLIEVVEVVAAGGESVPVPVPQREWFRQMMSATSPQRVLALSVEHGTEIYERVANLWPAVAAAVSDPDVARYWEGVATGRRNAQRGQVVRLADLGALKPGLDLERATDVLFLLAGHDPYRSLVQDAGWPIVEYRSWLFTTLVQQLLAATAIEPDAVADLSFGGLATAGRDARITSGRSDRGS